MVDLVGISKANLRSLIQRHDASAVEEHGGVVIQLFKRHVVETDPACHLLLVVTQMPDREPSLALAIKVYDDFAPDVAAIEPVELLRIFADRFGCSVRVGSIARKLWLGETAAVKPTDRVWVLDCATPRGYAAVIIPKADKVKGEVTIGLGLAVDFGLYEPYLAQRRE